MAGRYGDVVSFGNADPADVARLGGKGASLVAMSRLGLPVPPGFVISTEVCRAFLRDGVVPGDVHAAVDEHLAAMERMLGRTFGDASAPLLVSVRSGAPVSMPGMMDTILNLGLNDATVGGLIHLTGDAAFAWDCYLRLLRSYATTVRGITVSHTEQGRTHAHLEHAARSLLDLIGSSPGRPFPQDPRRQLAEAIQAVFASWRSPRAERYRRYAGIADDLGTAVVVQAMVFGNLAGSSGTGVAFTRDPATGIPEHYGDFLAGAQGEDVVAGERDVGSLEDCRAVAPAAFAELTGALETLERDCGDMCEVEFTVESGRLWILQSRAGQRTGEAAVRIAVDMISEGLIDADAAVARLHPSALLRLSDPVLDPDAPRDLIGRGVAASPGAAVGRIALTPTGAEEMAAGGNDVILVRPSTSPDDVAGMIAARGIVTAHGGRTSHAAVVARGMDRPAVCGVDGLEVTRVEARFASATLRDGDEISIDGSTGEVYRGAVPRVARDLDPRLGELLAYCDANRRVRCLSEGGPARWADGAFDGNGATVCRSDDDLAGAAGGAALVVDPSDVEGARGLIASAADAAARGATVFVRVDRSWPRDVSRLPAAPWAGITATEAGATAARLLAATVDPAT